MLFSKKEVNKIVFPLIAQQFLSISVNIIDSMMVASAGPAAISGVSLINTLNHLLLVLFSAIGAGGAVVVSQLLGKNDLETSRSASKQLIWVSFGISALVSLVSTIFNKPLLSLVFGKIDADVMKSAQDYFFYLAITYPALGIYNACASIFRAMGNSKISLTTSIIMNIVNIVFNSVFIYGFNMGAAGAAIATSISRIVGAAIMMILLYNKENPIYIEKLFRTKFNLSIIKNICGIGIPNGLENSMFQFGKVLTQSLIAGFGTAQIAANAVGNTVTALQYQAGTAIGMAMVTIVGRCIGAKEKEQAIAYTKKLMKMAYTFIIIISALMCVFVTPIVNMYQLEGESASLAVKLILFHSLIVCTVWPCSFTLPNCFRAASDVRYTMIISIISMWVFRVGLSYVFGLYMNLGVMGVWYAMACDWLFRAILFVIRFMRKTWLTKYKPIEE